MSAPRRPMAWLWAAIWLRWRLAGIKLRRGFAGSSTARHGVDYHLEPAEIPVEGADYQPNELPEELMSRLAATRAELHERARSLATARTGHRGRRRRLGALAVAALLGLSGAGAAAAALVTGSTGVAAVDRLLGIADDRVDQPGISGRPDGTARDFQPRPSGSSVSVAAPLGSRRLVASSYVARDGRVCSVLTEDDAAGIAGDVTCEALVTLERKLAQNAGAATGIAGLGGAVVIWGLADGRVTSLTGRGPRGPLDVHLGPRAALGDTEGARARGFIAVERSGADGTVDPREFVFHAVREDGSSATIRP
ncbi:MAG TPA: hypothetical protein VHF90_04585 [Thermoleophilaceae bacterium]|nr:hypothetical protein [Thermoleophilaceae bacterium]